MKTFSFIAAVITSAMLSISANAETVKNTKEVSAAPATVEIAKSNTRSMIHTAENGVSHKYDFVLDAEGRVVNRIVYVWNADNGTWVPFAAYSVVYTPEETILSYAKYNKKTKTYCKDVQQSRYNAVDYPIIFNIPECCK